MRRRHPVRPVFGSVPKSSDVFDGSGVEGPPAGTIEASAQANRLTSVQSRRAVCATLALVDRHRAASTRPTERAAGIGVTSG